MSPYFAEARRLAASIAAQAEVRSEGPGLTWSVRRPDPGAGHGSVPSPADAGLYQGVAGIVWFLGQVHERSDDETLRRQLREAVEGGVEHVRDVARKSPLSSWGFHAGRLGMAWTVLRLGLLFKQDGWRRDGLDLILAMAGQEPKDGALDVIGGAAGAIPALLDMRPLVADLDSDAPERLLAMARALGDHLLDTAHQEPDGWSWTTIPGSAYGNVTGYAHGTAGLPPAPPGLAQATGDGRFRFGADMAWLYEDRHFDPEARNWPDLRNVMLGEMLRGLPTEAQRRLAAEGKLPPYRRSFMSAWCHGAPGIALARLRAHELTADPRHLEVARLALATTHDSLSVEALERGNFSLCHGAAGNAYVLSTAIRYLQEREHYLAVRIATDWGLEQFGGKAWPCGTLDGAADPSLLVGEGGIGLFLLGQDDPELISPLMLRPAATQDDLAGGTEDRSEHAAYEKVAYEKVAYEKAAVESARYWFASTLDFWQRLGHGADLESGVDLDRIVQSRAADESPAAALFRHLEARSDDDLRNNGGLLADAFLVDRRRFEKSRTLEDFSAETRRALLRPAWEDLDLERAEWTWAADGELVFTEHDWLNWPSDQARPSAGPSALFLMREANRIRVRPVAPLVAVILQSLDEPGGARTIRQRVAAALDGGAAPEALKPIVQAQLEQLYRAGLLDPHPPPE